MKFDYKDYVRGGYKDIDITAFRGSDQCKKVEYIDIRGHVGYCTMVSFGQEKNKYMLVTDSSLHNCFYGGAPGGVPEEDNFGYYLSTDKQFKRTSDPSATTQFWFGGYV